MIRGELSAARFTAADFDKCVGSYFATSRRSRGLNQQIILRGIADLK
jgi:hypothetical protein